MISFIKRNIIFLGVIAATALLIVGGVILFSRGGNSNQNAVSADILVPKDAEITSGIVGGVYQPANPAAKVTVVEFGDYQCPACGAYNKFVDNLLTDFAGKINYVFRDFSFIGPESLKAAEASYCAADQNKFWEYHEYLYSHQNGENKGTFADANLKLFAKGLGLDSKAFETCLDTDKYKDKVDNGTNDGRLAGVDSTPTLFVNGVKIANPGTYDGLKSLIQDALNNAPLPSGTPVATYHIHFDLKAYLSGSPIDFTLAKYQESKTNPLDPDIHFHDGNGSVVHVHKINVPLSELFSSLKIAFPADSATNNLKVYVNDKLNPQGLAYIPQDIDQILVSFGPVNDANIQKQIASVTDSACIYSLTCPARGTPPPEDCVGGLGTGCTD